MKRGFLLFLFSSVAIIVFFQGCSYKYAEVPLATNFDSSEQKKLQSAHHWKVISKDLADLVVAKIDKQMTLYINKSQSSVEFSEAMNKLLLSSLVDAGASVNVEKATTDAVVTIDIQQIEFSSDKIKPKRTFGIPTMLTAGVWALREIIMSADATTTVAASTAAGAIGLDAYNWYNSEYALGIVPYNEVLITISVSKNNQYVASLSNIYYISDEDSELYRNSRNGLKFKGDK